MDEVTEYSDYTCFVAITINAFSEDEAQQIIHRAVMERIHGHLLEAQRSARIIGVSSASGTVTGVRAWMQQLSFEALTKGEEGLKILRDRVNELADAFAEVGKRGTKMVRKPAEAMAADLGDAVIDLDSWMGWYDDDEG